MPTRGSGHCGARQRRAISASQRYPDAERRDDDPLTLSLIHILDALSERLAEADVVASFMPSTPETRGLANAEFWNSNTTMTQPTSMTLLTMGM